MPFSASLAPSSYSCSESPYQTTLPRKQPHWSAWALTLQNGLLINMGAFLCPPEFWFITSNQLQYELILTKYICNNCISTFCYILRYWGFGLPTYLLGEYSSTNNIIQDHTFITEMLVNLLKFNLWPRTWSIFACIPWHLKRICILLLSGGVLCKRQLG